MILFIVEKFPSKSEHFISNEILGLREAGVDVQVFAMRKEVNTTLPISLPVLYANRFGLILHALMSLLNHNTLGHWRTRKSIRQFLSQVKTAAIVRAIMNKFKTIDHVHAHFAFLPTEIAQKLSDMTGIPFSFTAHAQDLYANDRSKLHAYLNQARFTFTCTQYGKSYLQEIAPMNENIHCIYHGIALEKWPFQKDKKVSTNKIKLLFVGRLVEKKGIHLLLEAIQQLAKDGKSIDCTLVGSGPLAKDLQGLTKTRGIQKMVHFAGYVAHDQLLSYYQQHDLLICPSIQAKNLDMDGLPNVILEAMAVGVPVIASNLSGIPEIIAHGHTGMLVNSGDVPAIVKNIKALSTDALIYQTIRKAARKQLEEKFNLKKSNHRIEMILKSATLS